MKKYLHIALMLLCVFVVSSCKDDNDDTAAVEQEAYKLENETAFLAKGQDPSYVKWVSEAGEGYVYAKLIKKGNGKQAYFNSLVSVYYKGSLIDGTVFQQQLFDDGEPFTCAVSPYYTYTKRDPTTGAIIATWSSVISGWSVALQNMVEGDKYEVYIPYQLAYGASGQGSIKPYSTLVFEIELVSIDLQAAEPN
jgi:FKBP-type peptidyl-prolyl cis-trans isomerase